MEAKKIEALLSGSHSPNSKMCIMEAAAYVADAPWSDSPECVSPVIGGFLRNWNDSLRDNESRTRLLAPLIPEILGTAGTEASETKRSWMAFDWLVREWVPAFMDLTESLRPHAKALRDLEPIYDKLKLEASRPTIEAARKASAAARAAASDALKPTVAALQESAADLVRRMAAVERAEFAIVRPLVVGDFRIGV